MESLQNINSVLLFKVGPVLCCAPSNSVESIIIPLEITRPPGTSDSMPGIFKHNGKIISLSDLRQKFGINMDDRKEPGRVIIANTSSHYTGFWVDEILDVIESPSQGWGMPPAYIPRDVFSGTLFHKDQIWLNTEFEKLLKMNECGYLQKYITSIKSKQDNKISAEAVKPAETVTKPSTTTRVTGNTTQDSEITVVQQMPATNIPIEQSSSNTPSPVSSIDGPGNTPQIGSATTLYKKDETIVTEEQDGVVTNEPTTSRTQPPRKTAAHPSLKNIIDKHQDASSSKISENIVTTKNTSLITGLLLVAVISTVTFLLFLAYEWSTPDKIRTSDPKSSITRNESSIKSKHLIENTDVITQNKTKKPAEPQTLIKNTSVGSKLANIEYHQLQNNIASTTEHRAVILKDGDGIIIELDSPVASAKINNREEEIETLRKYNQSPAIILSDKPTLYPKSTKNVELIEHTVVKGDTLWDIAKYYIDNPFRYPEIARLSNIKNPDLIYPGSRVLIIKHPIKKQTEN
ncbi:MAG: chemotaxis protein CheW [Gammaproteobacteria bacterium]|nr:chemotaxis protein CheW [Gammaproteobacteria bacterium]